MPRSSLLVSLCIVLALPLSAQVSVSSPDGRNTVTVQTHDGRLYYSVTRDKRPLLMPSMLGLALKDAPRPSRPAQKLVRVK